MLSEELLHFCLWQQFTRYFSKISFYCKEKCHKVVDVINFILTFSYHNTAADFQAFICLYENAFR